VVRGKLVQDPPDPPVHRPRQLILTKHSSRSPPHVSEVSQCAPFNISGPHHLSFKKSPLKRGRAKSIKALDFHQGSQAGEVRKRKSFERVCGGGDVNSPVGVKLSGRRRRIESIAEKGPWGSCWAATTAPPSSNCL
jgi:hypothetical protein